MRLPKFYYKNKTRIPNFVTLPENLNSQQYFTHEAIKKKETVASGTDVILKDSTIEKIDFEIRDS